MNNLIIRNVTEGNLQNISLEIPKEKLVVLTGLSGSGKSTLAIDVIYQECQRQYLEAMGYQGIQKPKIDSMQNVSPAIQITQTGYNKNPRSSLGTVTNIYTDLRMIFEKLSKRICPNCAQEISSSECKEELLKTKDNFTVYMYCSQCNYRMEKLTRTHFSYNTREGSCNICQGLGNVLTIDESAVLHKHLSLEAGAVDFWMHRYKEYQIAALYNAFKHYEVPIYQNSPVETFTDIQKIILLYGVEHQEIKTLFPNVIPPKSIADGKFEGILTGLWRKISDKSGNFKQLDKYFTYKICPDCKGERLNAQSRQVTVFHTRLPQLSCLPLNELLEWLLHLESSLKDREKKLAETYLLDLKTKITRIINAGLGYLSLDRQTMTLSGGEAQRIKLAATLDSNLTGIIYIMDEPTVGLHPKDSEGIIKILKALRDMKNTVIIIEHDTDVMRAADYIVDIGPGSGKYGGQVVGSGTLDMLKKQDTSITGAYLRKSILHFRAVRSGTGNFIQIENADKYNLQNINVRIPHGCLTTVTGVSGSGKSTLIFEVLAKSNNYFENPDEKQSENHPETQCTSRHNRVLGRELFDQIITVEQAPLAKMNRSNIATYSGAYSEIREIFGRLTAARDKGLSAKHFSFNTKGGRCESCEGLGYIVSNMLFFEDIKVPCPTCGGNQFKDEVLEIRYKGCNIKDILGMSIEDSMEIFLEYQKICSILQLLKDVGLGYLELGQTLTTLSGGEGQRLKLAKELIISSGMNNLYLIDEPTVGLHPIDVEHFLILLNRMLDTGSTVVVVEHNQQLINASDWIIDLGPGGGQEGGTVIAQGTPEQIKVNANSVTGRFI